MKRRIIRFLCRKTGPALQTAGLSALLLFSTADTATAPLVPLLSLNAAAMGIFFLGLYLEKALRSYWRRYCRKNRKKRRVKSCSKVLRDAA